MLQRETYVAVITNSIEKNIINYLFEVTKAHKVQGAEYSQE